jgi:hypothetical protein
MKPIFEVTEADGTVIDCDTTVDPAEKERFSVSTFFLLSGINFI